MKREPFTALLRSVWDCFVDPMSETVGERLQDAYDVIRCWWDPELQWGEDPLGDWYGRNL